MTLITGYQDANGVQFSSITPFFYTIGNPTQSLIEVYPAQSTCFSSIGSLAYCITTDQGQLLNPGGVFSIPINIPQSGSGTISEDVMNLGDSTARARVYLVLPREMSSGASSIAEQGVTIPPKQSVTVNFPVNAGGAIAPSSYLVALFGVYQSGSMLYSSKSSPVISIVAPTSWFLYAVALIILVAIGVAAYNYFKPKKRK
jgi:hypothetical protein